MILGVYLPLLWEQSFCWKSPIALGYTRGHFSALVAMENDGYDNRGAGANLNTDDDVTVTFLPLVDSERKLLHIHFLSAQEVRESHHLIAVHQLRAMHSGIFVSFILRLYDTLFINSIDIGWHLSHWLLRVSVRWVRKNNRSGCWGSGWTVAWRRAGFWSPCRRALGGGTTRSSLRWWRSGWTVIGNSPPVPLFLTGRKRRRTKMSEEQATWKFTWHYNTPLLFSLTRRNTRQHAFSPGWKTNKPEVSFWFLSLKTANNLGLSKIKECNHDCICLYKVYSLLFVCVSFLICCRDACSDVRRGLRNDALLRERYLIGELQQFKHPF